MIEKLDVAIMHELAKLDEISAYIKKVEKVLKKSPISFASTIIFKEWYLIYDGNRLCVKNKEICRPLIECNALIRVQFSILLEQFMEEYIQFLKKSKPYEPQK